MKVTNLMDDKYRIIGNLVYISSGKFVVELKSNIDNFTVVGFDDNHYIARLGSYLVIPTQDHYVISEITGIREKDFFDNKSNFELVSKNGATSIKYLDAIPVGMLARDAKGEFSFGVSQYPSLYSDVLYIEDKELDCIFQVQNSEFKINDDNPDRQSPGTGLSALTLGKSSVFENYDLKININDFFGAHSAILGNTGSGKSCTIAAILQTLFSKNNEYFPRGATFVLFDVNGEYEQSLSRLKHENIAVNVLSVGAENSDFKLPHWLLSVEEWELLLRASEKTQMPILRNALALARIFSKESDKIIKNHILATCIIQCLSGNNDGGSVAQIRRVDCLLNKYGDNGTGLEYNILEKHGCNTQYGNFSECNEKKFKDEVRNFIINDFEFPDYQMGPFEFDRLADCFDLAILYEEAHGNHHIRDYCSSLLTRLKSLKARNDYNFLKTIQTTPDDVDVQENLIQTVLGLDNSNNKLVKKAQIILFDLNNLEDELVQVVASVVPRLIFEYLREQPARNKFPVNLVLEEAHRYIAQKPSKYAIDANRIFERIAKEGRKYGLFIMLASQRPSELSKTVLSQCANYIIHRIQNPDDLQQIRQMTPFISEVLLNKLPSLPKQHALVFGNAINIPTTVRISDANPTNKSEDAKISELWFVPKDKETPLKKNRL